MKDQLQLAALTFLVLLSFAAIVGDKVIIGALLGVVSAIGIIYYTVKRNEK